MKDKHNNGIMSTKSTYSMRVTDFEIRDVNLISNKNIKIKLMPIVRDFG